MKDPSNSMKNKKGEQVLSPSQFGVLAILGRKKIIGRDLAQAYEKEFGEKMPFGTLYTLISRLAKKGLVLSCEGAVDRREKDFELSKEGRRAVKISRDFYRMLANFRIQ